MRWTVSSVIAALEYWFNAANEGMLPMENNLLVSHSNEKTVSQSIELRIIDVKLQLTVELSLWTIRCRCVGEDQKGRR